MHVVAHLMDLAAAGTSTRDIATELGTRIMRVSRAVRAIEAATGKALRESASAGRARRRTVDQIGRRLRATRGGHPAARGEAVGRLHRW